MKKVHKSTYKKKFAHAENVKERKLNPSEGTLELLCS